MRDVTKGVVGVVAYVVALVAFGEWVNHRGAAPEVQVTVDNGPDILSASDGTPGRVVVSLSLNQYLKDNEAALTDIIVPVDLADAVGLVVPEGWQEDSGPPYESLGHPVGTVPGYRHFKGTLQLARSKAKRLVLRLGRSQAAKGIVELRYSGHNEMCPLAGSIPVQVGTGPLLPPPSQPYPPDPVLRLIALC